MTHTKKPSNMLHRPPTPAMLICPPAAVETVGGADVVVTVGTGKLVLVTVPDPGSMLVLAPASVVTVTSAEDVTDSEVPVTGMVVDTGLTLVAGSGGVASTDVGVVSCRV